MECDSDYRCATVLIDRVSAARRRLGPARETGTPPGVISPDGHWAALPRTDAAGSPILQLLNLASGAEHPISASVAKEGVFNGTAMVWSPDSRWLFVVTTAWRIDVIDSRTRHGNGRILPASVGNIYDISLRTTTR